MLIDFIESQTAGELTAEVAGYVPRTNSEHPIVCVVFAKSLKFFAKFLNFFAESLKFFAKSLKCEITRLVENTRLVHGRYGEALGRLDVRYVRLLKGTFAKLQPVAHAFHVRSPHTPPFRLRQCRHRDATEPCSC